MSKIEHKTTRINIRVTPRVKQALIDKANELGITPTALIELLIKIAI